MRRWQRQECRYQHRLWAFKGTASGITASRLHHCRYGPNHRRRHLRGFRHPLCRGFRDADSYCEFKEPPRVRDAAPLPKSSASTGLAAMEMLGTEDINKDSFEDLACYASLSSLARNPFAPSALREEARLNARRFMLRLDAERPVRTTMYYAASS